MFYDPTQPAPPPPGHPSQPFSPPSAVPTQGRDNLWRSLGLPGQTALIAGLALLILFFLPWFSTPDIDHFFKAFTNGQGAPTISYSGWSAARGVALFFGDSSDSLALFPELWLILGGAVVLLVTVLLQSVRRLSARTTGTLLLCIGALLLAVELAFLAQVNMIQANFETVFQDNPHISAPVVYNVLWGFWLAVVVSAAALLIGGYSILQSRQSAGRAPGSMRDSSSLDWAGVIALVGGLALLISFFLPWFGVNITCSGRGCVDLGGFPETQVLDSSASAFRLAGNGFSVFYAVGNFANPFEIFGPAFLWLILLASVALCAAAFCMLQGTLSARQGRMLIVLIAGLALVVEAIFLFNAFGAFPMAKQHTSGSLCNNQHCSPSDIPLASWMLDIATGPASGFWIGLVATIAAGAGALFIKRVTLPASAGASLPDRFARSAAGAPGPYPTPPGAARDGGATGSGAQRLGLPGLAALLVGLAMLVGFFLPWLTTPNFSDHSLFISLVFGRAVPPTSAFSGWALVNGVSLTDPSAGPGGLEGTPLRLFPQFWLVLLGGVMLLVVAGLLSLGRLSGRIASRLLLGISLVVLLLEPGLLVQAQALQTDFAGRVYPTIQASGISPTTAPVLFGVSWGFWVSVAISAAGVALGALSLLRRQQPAPALAGVAVQPGQGERPGQPPAP